MLLARQFCLVRPRIDPGEKVGTTSRLLGPLLLILGLDWTISEGRTQAESINSPLDLTAFFLDDGTVGGHEAQAS